MSNVLSLLAFETAWTILLQGNQLTILEIKHLILKRTTTMPINEPLESRRGRWTFGTSVAVSIFASIPIVLWRGIRAIRRDQTGGALFAIIFVEIIQLPILLVSVEAARRIVKRR